MGLLAICAALSLGVAACSSDVEALDDTALGSPGDEALEDTDLPVQNDDGSGAVEEEADPGDVTPGYTRLTPRSDLVSLEPGLVEKIIVDPDNVQQLLLHFQGASEPCSGVALGVEETDTSVIVDLQVGLDPNAAAMSCIAQVFDYEVVLRLDAPLGDRTINVVG